ncbi:unnamed protein product, partial [Polarella glacialis]
ECSASRCQPLGRSGPKQGAFLALRRSSSPLLGLLASSPTGASKSSRFTRQTSSSTTSERPRGEGARSPLQNRSNSGSQWPRLDDNNNNAASLEPSYARLSLHQRRRIYLNHEATHQGPTVGTPKSASQPCSPMHGALSGGDKRP